jgi:purine-nucleoside phosphorylase
VRWEFPLSSDFADTALQLRVGSIVAENLGELRVELHQGRIWSTDAPFTESTEKVRDFRQGGAVAVDMEFAAISHLAERRGIQAAGVFVISDLLGESWMPRFGAALRRLNLEALCKILLKELAL